MIPDETPIGRILNRRELIQIFGVAFLSGSCQFPSRQSVAGNGHVLPSCIVRPEQTEGPFFKDVELERSDIRVDPASGDVSIGTPLDLTFQVLRVDGSECVPLPGARVDLWQCNIEGRYSAFRDRGLDLREEKFLRGYQITGEDGIARFMTVYPGWYGGRTVHLHFKMRTESEGHRGYEFTSQLYFNDALTDQVHAQPPYSEYGERRTRNSNDGIFRRSGNQLMLDLSPTEVGYEATFPIGMAFPD